MALFDAATEEMKKRRNQKKDGSIVKRMERLSALVEPTEVVYSPGGNIKKERHIDDLEDASSLIDGESPLPKQKQFRPRKRQALVEKDVNAPRLVRRKAEGDLPKKRVEPSFTIGLPPLPYLPSSSTGDSYILGSRYLPTEEDEGDFKPPLASASARKCKSPFQIFNDGSPGYATALPAGEGRNVFQSGRQPFLGVSRPQPSMLTAPWLPPHYQSALQYTNPYTSYRPLHREFQGFYDSTFEGSLPLADLPPDFRGTSTNPLSWRSPARESQGTLITPESPFGSSFGLFLGATQSDDPFMTTKNPLADALGHLEAAEDGSDVKERARSPAETVSDNGSGYRSATITAIHV